MINMFSLLTSMAAALLGDAVPFDEYVSLLQPEEQTLLAEAGITSSEDVFSLLEMAHYQQDSSITSGCEAMTESEIQTYLQNEHPGFIWRLAESKTTQEITGSIPVEVYSGEFPFSSVAENPADQLPGCGPIALIGALEFFSRAFNYTEIMPNPSTEAQRRDLSSLVISNVQTFHIPFTNLKITNPTDYIAGFNTVAGRLGISDQISIEYHEAAESTWDTIVEAIDEGMPATIANLSINPGSDDFEGHYATVYGYQVWEGVHPTSHAVATEKLIQAKLNRNRPNKNFVSARMLTLEHSNFFGFELGTHVFTYHINDASLLSSTIRASDFANDFVNEDGQGQYFFYEKPAVIDLEDDTLDTKRLRCSYIENQYLVLSPNRIDAGTAYLEIGLFNYIEKMTFKAALWSAREFIDGQSFTIQGYRNGAWKTFGTIDPSSLTIARNAPLDYTVHFGKGVRRIRFLTVHNSPMADRNKGRIVIDNITFLKYEL